MSADHIVILILLLALVLKFVFFENKQELVEQLRVHMTENPDQKSHKEFAAKKCVKEKEDEDEMPFFKSGKFFLGRKDLGR